VLAVTGLLQTAAAGVTIAQALISFVGAIGYGDSDAGFARGGEGPDGPLPMTYPALWRDACHGFACGPRCPADGTPPPSAPPAPAAPPHAAALVEESKAGVRTGLAFLLLLVLSALCCLCALALRRSRRFPVLAAWVAWAEEKLKHAIGWRRRSGLPAQELLQQPQLISTDEPAGERPTNVVVASPLNPASAACYEYAAPASFPSSAALTRGPQATDFSSRF
jgi:hypothetical protein